MRRNPIGCAWTARRTAATLAVTFALIGCGGGATASTAGEPEASVGAAESAAPAASAPAAASEAPPASQAPAAGGGDLNTAVVRVGGETYEFSGIRCDILAARYIQAGAYGEDPELVIVLPPEGWESQGDVYSPPSVRVTIGDPYNGGNEWVAGDDDTWFGDGKPADSRIDSYTVPDGRPVTATGTASFVDRAALATGNAAPAQTGDFEVTCP